VLSAAEFDRLVEAALGDIPKRFRRRIENVAIIV
jgi:predicted Zn-dependent protease with MMP-like domain